MNTSLIDALRYRSEGTDLDFKRAQYRFVGASDAEKAELLKDILAIANAWREGPGHILLGFRDARPHPAEVTGISEHLDDAQLQQFVGSKVKPKLTFHYEECLHEGKTVAVISIPKQPRPFYLQHAYGGLKSNVVYVRRGSSTDEAEPPEVAKMVATDTGRGDAVVDLVVTHPGDVPLQAKFERRFFTFDRLPDYALPATKDDPFGLAANLTYTANSRYWRELAEFAGVRASAVVLCYSLTNRSAYALNGTKLEVSAVPLDGQQVQLSLGTKLPSRPVDRRSMVELIDHRPSFAEALRPREPVMVIDAAGGVMTCHVRLGTLLPGEAGRAPDSVVLRAAGPGRVEVRCRILAAELATPLQRAAELIVEGPSQHLGVEGLMAAMNDPQVAALLGSSKTQRWRD